ncbi:Zinc finger, PMZ-type, partial [Sesbania bispinosa]
MGELAPKAQSGLEKANRSCGEWHPRWVGDAVGFKFEVTRLQQRKVVDLGARSCSCNLWGLTGIPCEHVVAYLKVGVKPVCLLFAPPVIRKKLGRPKKKRNRSNDETLAQPGAGHKMRRVYGDICCSRCRHEGHNMKGYPKTKEAEQRPNEVMVEDEEVAIDAACDIALTTFEGTRSPTTPRSGPRTRSQTQTDQNLSPGCPATPISGVRTRSQTMADQNLSARSLGTPISGVRTRSQTMADQNLPSRSPATPSSGPRTSSQRQLEGSSSTTFTPPLTTNIGQPITIGPDSPNVNVLETRGAAQFR